MYIVPLLHRHLHLALFFSTSDNADLEATFKLMLFINVMCLTLNHILQTIT